MRRISATTKMLRMPAMTTHLMIYRRSWYVLDYFTFTFFVVGTNPFSLSFSQQRDESSQSSGDSDTSMPALVVCLPKGHGR